MIKSIKNFGEILKDDIKNLNSLIINNNKEYNKRLKSWINPMDNINAELLYRLTRDGEKVSKFHELCDNKGPTLTIIKTTNNKIFGGFTPLNWESSGNGENKYDKSNQTFLFSLDLIKKFDMINAEKAAIYCNKNNGPYFGGRDFSIESNMKTGQTYANSETNFISWKPNKKKEINKR